MTKEQLFDLIGQADEIYIRDAAQGKKRRQRWTIWGAAAACLVLVGVILWQEWPAAQAIPSTGRMPTESPTRRLAGA